MAEQKEELFGKLSDAVVEMDEERTVEVAKEVLDKKFDAYEAIDKGLANGMERAGDLFDEEEYFIPELLMCSDAMYAGIDVLKPHLKSEEREEKQKIVIGVVQGDTHDIGKNLVKIMFETAGFEVFDLGRDIAPQDFVDKAKEVKADIIALSTLMTTTMEGMAEVVRILEREGIREQFKIMVGGGPISQGFADKIGADAYARNAAEAAKRAKEIVEEGRA